MEVIAICGMAGAGKSELAKLFEKERFKIIRFGDITDELIVGKGLVLSEENERKIRESLRKEHGMEAYAKLNLPRIKDAMSKQAVVIDGLYSWEEYLFLKKELGDDLTLLAIYSSPKERYERLVDRDRRSLTAEQARERDHKEIQNLNKAAPIAMADYTLLNTGTLYDLEMNFNKFMEWLREEEEE